MELVVLDGLVLDVDVLDDRVLDDVGVVKVVPEEDVEEGVDFSLSAISSVCVVLESPN